MVGTINLIIIPVKPVVFTEGAIGRGLLSLVGPAISTLINDGPSKIETYNMNHIVWECVWNKYEDVDTLE